MVADCSADGEGARALDMVAILQSPESVPQTMPPVEYQAGRIAWLSGAAPQSPQGLTYLRITVLQAAGQQPQLVPRGARLRVPQVMLSVLEPRAGQEGDRMSSRQLDEEAVFHLARGIDDLALRSTYLEQICAGDQALRDRVEDLLRAHEHEGFLRSSQSESAPTAERTPLTERPGLSVGRYKLLQELGEGGMGTVFMAEQVEPVQRRVALRVIKQGMDTRQFIARFEAERQALALMDHPNIARVLDAGCTETGRPYFVMELVKGVPINRFCDENRLTTQERLNLFVSVCHAVQHAHQKGIIHRDLKPSNVLVALYDDRPVPKIIDFGVAKATNQQLTEETLFTQVGQIVGTWEYMSPEQAVLNQIDVDTRTDIYSLGVILYELLTGVTPLESSRLRSAALDEMLRLIQEEEPPRPSNRISSLAHAPPPLPRIEVRAFPHWPKLSMVTSTGL